MITKQNWTAVLLILMACAACTKAHEIKPQPVAASRVVYLGQTDGRRCADGAPLLIERLTSGSYLFLLIYGGPQSVAPLATVTLQERGDNPAWTSLWQQTGVQRIEEDGSFAVFVPANSLPNARYQFTLHETVAGKEEYLGRFAFTLVQTGDSKVLQPQERPCGA